MSSHPEDTELCWAQGRPLNPVPSSPRPPPPVFTRHCGSIVPCGLGALLPFPLQPLQPCLLGLAASWLHDG